MLRYLADLSDWLGPFRVFDSVPFRAVAGLMLAFFGTLFFAPGFIRWMRHRRATEDMGKDSATLESLHAGKRGTPTMGGVVIVVVMLLTILLTCDPLNPLVWLAVGVLVAYAGLGLLDDYMKLRGLGKRGLTIVQKLVVQFLIAGGAAIGAYLLGPGEELTKILVPFTKWNSFSPDLGWVYFIFFMIVMVACTNAVNLTDGLDGLAAGCVVMVAMAYAVLAYVIGDVDISTYLRIPLVEGAGELGVLCMIMAGATMGFLWFNAHPARVFMGDTGSLALGGVIGFVSLMTKHELVLIVIGGIFFAEGLSVLIQIVSFRIWGKRIFKCAPLHHHLEFSGWDENHVVVRLWMVGGMLTAAGLATLKMH